VGAAVGTPAYMSPEQAAGKLDELGPASDVYSLGATLYCLLTGKAPFEGQDAGEVLRRVQRGAFPPPRAVKRAVPAALEAVCLKALALRPGDRYGTARALADDIEHWLADEPVAAYREPWPARLARWGRRHRPLVAAALALLLTAVAALAAGIVVVNGERQATEAARRRTREALDEMSSQVIEDWLAQRKQLEPAQRAFLEKALAYYEEFAQESGHTQEVRQSVARAHLRVANIRRRLGQHQEAEAAYRRAGELYARLAADFPAVPQYRHDLAATHNNLGIQLKDTGRHTEAEGAFRDALVIQTALADDFPDVPRYRKQLANAHNNLGALLAETGRAQEAEAAWRDARDLRKGLAADFPAVPEYRQDLAQTHGNLGIVLQGTGRPKEAEAAYRDALELQKGLAADFPAVPQYREELAWTHNNLGLLLADTGHPKEAEAAYADALAIQKALAADFPAVPEYQSDLANTLDNLAELLRRRKDSAAARQLLEQARPHLQAALDANPRHPVYREFFCENRRLLAATLLDLGEHTGAAATAADLARVAADPAGDPYKAAGFFSRCVPLAEKEAKLSEARRQELAKSYGDRALQALRQAVAKGYKDADHLKKDPDLDPLRGRDDFRKLLGEVEAAAKPEQKKGP
jgi:tetratricopeptide (TPR) repeat protein